MTDAVVRPRKRFLTMHDHGMGATYWWIRATTAREVLETFAEVEVIDSRQAVDQAEGWNLAEVDVDAHAMPADLDNLRATRDAQRVLPGFGAFADRTVLYLRRRWEEEDDTEPMTYLMEVGADGRRLRQVEQADDGTAVKSDPEDWPLNPPVVDLFDPELAEMEITRDEFEEAWLRARREHSE